MNEIAICVNIGSSSVKLAAFNLSNNELINNAHFNLSTETENHRAEIYKILEEFTNLVDKAKIKFISHRIVHGGKKYARTVKIDEIVYNDIKELSKLAPLHNKVSLIAIDYFLQFFPDLDQMACFDTAFFTDLPLKAKVYPLPYNFYSDLDIQKYGFHGLSHAYCYNKVSTYFKNNNLKIIIAHLGAGASLSAIKNAVCKDTTMGFTPLDGLTMATRCGSIDAGIILHLLSQNYNFASLNHTLNYESGLKGLSQISGDFKEILDLYNQDKKAKLAIDVFMHNLKKHFLAMLACLNGLDVIVFTGGIGENSAYVRQKLLKELSFLKIKINKSKNDNCHFNKSDLKVISSKSSKTKVIVIKDNEELALYLQAKEI